MSEIARSMQMSAQDTVRWGDRVGLQFGPSPSSASLSTALAKTVSQGKQLVNLHWRWPSVYQVALVLVPDFAAGETGDVTVTYRIIFGSGNNIATTRAVTIPSSGFGLYNTQFDLGLTLPAQDIQIDPVAITTSDSHPLVGPGSLEIGAFVAPVTEVHAMTHMLECLCSIVETEQRQGRWMGPGFTEERMGYHR